MDLIPFGAIFREVAEKEGRSFVTRGFPGLPDAEYALLESYCPDPDCDCRRVMLNVACPRLAKGYLASVSYGFDREGEMAGPFLDPLNPQSQYADKLFIAVTEILEDQTYVSRLESHYQRIKQAATDPQEPAYEIFRLILEKEKAFGGETTRRASRKATTGKKRRRRK